MSIAKAIGINVLVEDSFRLFYSLFLMMMWIMNQWNDASKVMSRSLVMLEGALELQWKEQETGAWLMLHAIYQRSAMIGEIVAYQLSIWGWLTSAIIIEGPMSVLLNLIAQWLVITLTGLFWMMFPTSNEDPGWGLNDEALSIVAAYLLSMMLMMKCWSYEGYTPFLGSGYGYVPKRRRGLKPMKRRLSRWWNWTTIARTIAVDFGKHLM